MTATTGPESVAHIPQLQEWITAVAGELGLDPSAVDFAALLDVTRDVAHGVARPAGPLTTFLLGMAIAEDGASADAVARVRALAASWAQGQGQAEPTQV